MKADNIDQLIANLESVMTAAVAGESRTGFFAAMYHTVTCRVKQGILNNEFEDNARMELLDVTFANRYLAALERWESKDLPTASWLVAFKASRRSRYLLLHHLLLGINAHINLDLGIAAVEVTRKGALNNIRNDFNAINRIIAELTAELVNRINRISPFLSLLGLHAKNYNSVFIQFAISSARDGAWAFAEELSGRENNNYDAYILERDAKIQKLAEGIIHANFLLRVSIFIIRIFEWRKPSKIIRELYTKKEVYFTVQDAKVTATNIPKAIVSKKSQYT